MSDLDARLNAMNRINAVLETLDRPDTVVVLHALMEQYRVYYEPPHYLKGRHAVKTIAAALGLILLAVVPAWADGPSVKQSTCTATWTAPQTSADGSNLNDLKEYRIYAATTLAGLTATLPPVAVVAAPSPDPAANATVSWPCKTLALGQWYITATAADTSGNEGVRAVIAPFVSTPDPDVVAPSAPTAPVVVGP